MKNKLGIALMALGLAMLVASVGLLIWNHWEATRADAASRDLLPAVSQVIAQNLANEKSEEFLPATELPAARMKEVEVDGHLCVGFMTIPQLNLIEP